MMHSVGHGMVVLRKHVCLNEVLYKHQHRVCHNERHHHSMELQARSSSSGGSDASAVSSSHTPLSHSAQDAPPLRHPQRWMKLCVNVGGSTWQLSVKWRAIQYTHTRRARTRTHRVRFQLRFQSLPPATAIPTG